jgi:hypothetical protein
MLESGKYTKSIDNKRYAKDALALLRDNDSWSNDPLLLFIPLKDLN